MKRVYMRWIRLLIHLFHLIYINNIFIHFKLLNYYLKDIFLPGVLDSLRVLWYHHAKFSKKYLGFLAGIHH